MILSGIVDFMGLKNRLIEWYEVNKRDLPWRKSKNPYLIWLSEIILQQTRIDQGLNYYLRFAEKYPHVEALANAPMDDVLKLWQGLGYYNRARNMHYTANTISRSFDGVFPKTYLELLKLKGIGPYTAAAIASIAFNEPVPVVDGNVLRLFTRYFGISDDISQESTRKRIGELSHEIMDRQHPGIFNQAVMEFGALQCVPVNPDCLKCPLNDSCYAHQYNRVADLPVKRAPNKQKSRFFNYLIVRHADHLFIEKRKGKDIWQLLYQFPLIETSEKDTLENIIKNDRWVSWFREKDLKLASYDKEFKHILSHQVIYASFLFVEVLDADFDMPPGWIRIKHSELRKYPVPRLIDKFLSHWETFDHRKGDK